MKPPYRLVPDVLSESTIDCLRDLLHDAEQGAVLGIAFVAMLKGRRYIANTAGECRRNRTFTRGMLDDLHDRLGPSGERA